MSRRASDKVEIHKEEDENGNVFLIVKDGFTNYRIAIPKRDETVRLITKFGYGIKERLDFIVEEHQKLLDDTDMDDKIQVKNLVNRHNSEGKFFIEMSIYSCDLRFNAILKEQEWSAETIDAIRRAYTFGVEAGGLTQDFYWKFEHEDAAVEGHRHREGRKRGQPAATARRKQLGKKSRRAIIEAAMAILSEQPKFRFNLTQLAQEIEAQKLDALRKADGTNLGHHAIYKHLRAARNAGQI